MMTRKGGAKRGRAKLRLAVFSALFFSLILYFLFFIPLRIAFEKVEGINVSAIEKQIEENKENLNLIAEKLDKPLEAKGYPTFVANTTAYDSDKACTGKDKGHPAYGITASGKKVQAMKTIAMGPQFPFGTLVMIEGFDGVVFEVQDRGGAIKGNDIDIYMDTHNEALNYGVQQKQVWVIQYGQE